MEKFEFEEALCRIAIAYDAISSGTVFAKNADSLMWKVGLSFIIK
jgi:hypothetical protein